MVRSNDVYHARRSAIIHRLAHKTDATPQIKAGRDSKTPSRGKALKINSRVEATQPQNMIMAITGHAPEITGYLLRPNKLPNLSFQTINTASRTIRFDIFDWPTRRSIKIIGTSVIFAPSCADLKCISI